MGLSLRPAIGQRVRTLISRYFSGFIFSSVAPPCPPRLDPPRYLSGGRTYDRHIIPPSTSILLLLLCSHRRRDIFSLRFIRCIEYSLERKKKRKKKKKRKGKKEAEITRGRNIVVNTFGRIPGEGSGWFFFFSPSLFSLFSRRGNDVISSLAIIRLGQLHYRAGRGVYAASSRDTSGIITGSG